MKATFVYRRNDDPQMSAAQIIAATHLGHIRSESNYPYRIQLILIPMEHDPIY
jgi:hypothetical protein